MLVIGRMRASLVATDGAQDHPRHKVRIIGVLALVACFKAHGALAKVFLAANRRDYAFVDCHARAPIYCPDCFGLPVVF
jgi:hypothetical protein